MVILFTMSFLQADLLDGSKRLHFHNLKFLLELVVFQRNATAFVLLKCFEFGLELVVGALQVLDELMLRFHHNDLFVQLVLQVVCCLTHFLLNFSDSRCGHERRRSDSHLLSVTVMLKS